MLAKTGWWSGNPSAIFTAPVDDVINAYHYEVFCRNYEITEYELNKDRKRQ